jgi:hypothetical protein
MVQWLAERFSEPAADAPGDLPIQNGSTLLNALVDYLSSIFVVGKRLKTNAQEIGQRASQEV